MDLETLKKNNGDYKTCNIGGLLYLINDSGDELGYHYGKNIITPVESVVEKIENYFTMLSQKNIKYILNIIPDKSCVMKNNLENI